MECENRNGMTEFNSQVDNTIKYYDIASKKVQVDINRLLLKLNTTNKLTAKELDRIKQYSFRYKMIIQANAINTDSRLNKLHRTSLTHQSNKFT